MWGQPPSAVRWAQPSSALMDQPVLLRCCDKICRVSPRWTAEGGCPQMSTSDWRRCFSWRIEERQTRHLHIRLQADRFDRDFHLQRGPGLRMLRLYAGQGNHLLQDWRP